MVLIIFIPFDSLYVYDFMAIYLIPLDIKYFD